MTGPDRTEPDRHRNAQNLAFRTWHGVSGVAGTPDLSHCFKQYAILYPQPDNAHEITRFIVGAVSTELLPPRACSGQFGPRSST